MVEIYFSESCVRIGSSYRIPKAEFGEYIALIFERYPHFRKGSRSSLKWEWATHNFLYRMGYKKERTSSVDFENPQSWWKTCIYKVSGMFSWMFIG